MRVADASRSPYAQADAAALLTEHGVRTVRSLGPVEQVEDDQLTVWQYIEHDPALPYASRELGTAVRSLHDIPVPAAEAALGKLPVPVDTLARGRGRVEQLEAFGTSETGVPAGVLRAAFDAVEAVVVDVCGEAENVLLHGDLNPGNVLRVTGETPYIIDLEAFAVGPWTWDLINTQMLIADGDLPAETLEETLAGYGRHVRDDPTWAPLCRLRALNVVTWMYLEARAGGAVRPDQARRRVQWFLAGFPGLPVL